MTTSGTGCVALIAGGSGIVGHSVATELKRQGWSVRALARRPIAGITTKLFLHTQVWWWHEAKSPDPPLDPS